jgi:hypothetical protein
MMNHHRVRCVVLVKQLSNLTLEGKTFKRVHRRPGKKQALMRIIYKFVQNPNKDLIREFRRKCVRSYAISSRSHKQPKKNIRSGTRQIGYREALSISKHWDLVYDEQNSVLIKFGVKHNITQRFIPISRKIRQKWYCPFKVYMALVRKRFARTKDNKNKRVYYTNSPMDVGLFPSIQRAIEHYMFINKHIALGHSLNSVMIHNESGGVYPSKTELALLREAAEQARVKRAKYEDKPTFNEW